ncbi:MAG: hypothetical protein MRECE_7c012 [Mycoplasmataceae bacterium CE_OT135]|nr:MAG: hypothetical protein MRECE_7c012 [Mycoplasmataceae bacterium CE_OT135]
MKDQLFSPRSQEAKETIYSPNLALLWLRVGNNI